jgi:hypothetical protein
MSNIPRMLKGVLLPRPSVAQVRCIQDNMGDIMVYNAIDKLMAGINIVSFSKDSGLHRWIQEMPGFRRMFRYAMLGGGTLIFTARKVGWLGNIEQLLTQSIPLCTFGTGVVDPNFVASAHEAAGMASPIDEKSIQGWLACLERFPFVGVRGFESERILKVQGLKSVEVVGDPAVVYAYEQIQAKPMKKRIGINVLTTQHFWPGSKEFSKTEMLSLIINLVKDNWDVVLFPACDEDLDFTGHVRKQSGLENLEVFSNYLDVDAYLAGIAAMDLFVGMRLHSVVAACCSYTPAMMISYQPKGVDFMETIGLERFHLRSDQFSAEELMERIRLLYASIEQVQQEQYEKCALMKQRLHGFARRVEQHLMQHMK